MKYLLLFLTINAFSMGLIKPHKPDFKFDPQIGVAGLVYSWYNADFKSEIKEIAKVADEVKIDKYKVGVVIEAQGIESGVTMQTWKEDLRSHYEKLPVLVQAAADSGLWVHVVLYNSNTSGKGYHWKNPSSAFIADAQKYILEQMTSVIKKLDDKKLTDHCVFNFMSEDDNSTPSSIRSAARNLATQLLDKEHIMVSDHAMANVRWLDRHPAHVSSAPKAGVNDIITSDNGSIIAELFSKDETGWATTPKVDQAKQFMAKVGSQGITSFYFVDTKSSFKKNRNLWKEILKAAP